MSTLQNESTAIARIFANVPMYAYAMAMGNDTLSDAGDELFTLAMSDDGIDAKGALQIAGELYDAVRSQAVAIGAAKGKPMKEQKPNSRNSQVSKLANFPMLGVYHRNRPDEAVATVYSWAREATATKYGKLQKALVAMKDTLAKDKLASEATLSAAAAAALVDVPKPASEEIERIAGELSWMVRGDEKKESPYRDAFAAMLRSYPQDTMEHVAQALATVAARLRKDEEAAAAAIATAKARASNTSI